MFDPSRRFVRVTGRRADGFIEFDFAVGEPEIFIEMVMSPDDFEHFRAEQRAAVLATREMAHAEVAKDDWSWRLADVQRTFED